MKKQFILLLCSVFATFIANTQDVILFTLDNQPVMKSEFDRLYFKNNNGKPTDTSYAEEDIQRFVNFKLKVHEAELAGYDTLKQFVQELAGYRKQLARPYLQDRTLIDNLLNIVYYRTTHEINAGHIMIKLSSGAPEGDTLKAYERICSLRDSIKAGASFERLARNESEDQSSAVNEGRLGWFSAFSMILPFENAAYNTKPGNVSEPVRTRYGYHLIKVYAIRPAPGEIKLAHILIRTGSNTNPEEEKRAKERIDSCYILLQQKQPFANIARLYSEDAGSSKSGGQMRWIRSGELPPYIEDAVYALTDSGNYTKPIRSEYGWHIFQLQGNRRIPDFESVKPQLEERIMSDERGKIAERSFIDKLKKTYGFTYFKENALFLADVMDSTVYSGQWDPQVAGELIDPVFIIDTAVYSQMDLAHYIASAPDYLKSLTLNDIVTLKCNEFINMSLVNFEDSKLESKHAEFRDILKEYHDGILFFNIMNDSVWNRYLADTVGFNTFYRQHAQNYKWEIRMEASVYSCKDKSYLSEIKHIVAKNAVNKWPAKEIIEKVCGTDTSACITVQDMRFEKNSDQLPVEGIKWKEGFQKTYYDNGNYSVFYINKIIPSTIKKPEECRGQVILDYQNYLDNNWITRLRNKYAVYVNQEAFQLIN